MVQRGFWMLLLFVCLMCGCSSIPDRISMRERNVVSRIVEDHGEFYDSDTLGGLGRGIILASAVANTTADRELHASFQTSVRGATTDDWFDFLHANEMLGDGTYTLPIMAGAWGLGVLLPEDTHTTAMREWGERSMRSFLVGAPPLIALQKATGGSRPGEVENASKWRPFRDNNGVSGHSFMSAPCRFLRRRR